MVHSVDYKRKRSTTVHFLELPRTAIEPIKLFNLVSCYLKRCLVSIDLFEPSLTAVKNVYAFDELSRILLK